MVKDNKPGLDGKLKPVLLLPPSGKIQLSYLGSSGTLYVQRKQYYIGIAHEGSPHENCASTS
ncbi:MAG: hypothetical protein CM15mP86_08610 [Gammaproteobacteria bacterium]|nr:MAG: hypothetical protein CM15mP86_08610 [Gammaproteobacteria bacterium]